MSDEKQKLYEKQKAMLDQFLKTGAIDRAQYEKSLNGLKEKMGENEGAEQLVTNCNQLKMVAND